MVSHNSHYALWPTIQGKGLRDKNFFKTEEVIKNCSIVVHFGTCRIARNSFSTGNKAKFRQAIKY